MRPSKPSSPLFVLLLALLAVPLAGCVRDRVTGEQRVSLVHWTPEEEIRIGREQSPDIESLFDAIAPDAEANRQLGDLVRELVGHSVRRGDFDFRFKVLNSSVPNALALPGGFVYITRGLLEKLESEGQLVSVMGHELGHVEHQHSMQNLSRGRISGIFTAPLRLGVSLTEGLPGEGVVGLAAGLAATPLALWGLKFSREQELEADERGVFFSATMGYDPREGLKTFRMFERLERESGAEGELAWFRTHPVNEDRIAHIEETVAKTYPQLRSKAASDFRQDSAAFGAVLAKFRERAPAYKLYDEAVALLGKEKRTPEDLGKAVAKLEEAGGRLPDEPLVAIARGEAAILKEEKAAARAQFVAAVELYEKLVPGDGHWKPHFYLGVLDLQAKEAASALAHLEEAARRVPGQPAVQLVLGRAYEESGNRVGARAAYRKVLEQAPSDSELHREARERLRRLD
jgi:predicted Zn-dependent protease